MLEEIAGGVTEVTSNQTEKVFGLNWKSLLPRKICNDQIIVKRSSFSNAKIFLKVHHDEIYKRDQKDHRFLTADLDDRKERYYQNNGDFFSLVDTENNRVFGVFVGTTTDWNSYYFRNCSILPSYQGKGIYQELLKFLMSVLYRHGVKRVEGDVAPSNLGHIHVLNRLGFNISGVILDERWGSVVHFVKYLDAKHEDTFLRQFCYGVTPQKNERRPS